MDPDNFLNDIQQQAEKELLAKEQVYNHLREMGQEAPAIILNLMDTGIRIGDNASMLRFNLEVHPTGHAAFRAGTQSAISDTSRPKFVPGATVYVRFDPNNLTQVAIDHAPTEAPKTQVVRCQSCGAVQDITDGRSACAYCGSPL